MPIDIKDKTIEVFGRTLHRTYADDWIAEWDWSNEQFSLSAKLSVLPVGHGSEPTRRASVHVAYQGTDRRSAYFDEFDQTIEAAEANLKQFFTDITWFASEGHEENGLEETAETLDASDCELTSREHSVLIAAYSAAQAIERVASTYDERKELCAWAAEHLGDIHHIDISVLPEGSAALPLAMASVEEDASHAARDAGEQWGGPAHRKVFDLFLLALRWELFGRPSGRGSR